MQLPLLPSDSHICNELADYWLHNARMEHAAIGAFARLELELLSVGAAPGLLRDAASAITDEIGHAEICFSLASHYSGESISPGAYPGIISGGLRKVSLAELARESFVDGAIGEGVATEIALEQSRVTTDEALRNAYETISREEARHAVLGWDIVMWTLSSTTGREHDQIVKTLQGVLTRLTLARSHTRHAQPMTRDKDLEAYGLLSGEVISGIQDRVYTEMIEKLRGVVGERKKGWSLFGNK